MRLTRILCALTFASALWAFAVFVTGGFRLDLAGIRISSREPRNALITALACALALAALSAVPARRAELRADLMDLSSRWWPIAVRFGWAVPVAVLVYAAAIDVLQWSIALPLWVDEEMIALNVRDRTIAALDGRLWMGQSAPLGWLVVERAALVTFGTGELSMRALPLLFGIATVAAALIVGRRWLGLAATIVFMLMCWAGVSLSHYRFEIKHYSADAFFGLAIPALAMWAIDGDSTHERIRRGGMFWVAAALSQWMANGALFVAPACAVVLCASFFKRDGARAALGFAGVGFVWLASFALHYYLSIRHTHADPYLRSTWQNEMLPASIGLWDSVRWWADRVEPLARNPGSTQIWWALWLLAIGGFAFAVGPLHGSILAGVVVSAFALAPVVPLHQRFVIWIVPALYLGVAALFGKALALARDGIAQRRWRLVAVATLLLVIEGRLCADILATGWSFIAGRRTAIDKHQLDDRAAMNWLLSQHRDGDVFLAMRLTLPAVWWYGDIPLSEEGAGSVARDGSPVYELSHTWDCAPQSPLARALEGRKRALLYLGFDVAPEFEELLLRDLGSLGRASDAREFAPLGRAAIIDLGASAPESFRVLRRQPGLPPPVPGGCVNVKPAVRW